MAREVTDTVWFDSKREKEKTWMCKSSVRPYLINVELT